MKIIQLSSFKTCKENFFLIYLDWLINSNTSCTLLNAYCWLVVNQLCILQLTWTFSFSEIKLTAILSLTRFSLHLHHVKFEVILDNFICQGSTSWGPKWIAPQALIAWLRQSNIVLHCSELLFLEHIFMHYVQGFF